MRIQERIKRKFHTDKGFTLAETLLAVLIMLLVSGIVASGIPVAKNAYEEVVLASNAEVLLSTTISALRSELGTAQEVDEIEAATGERADSVLTYYNGIRGTTSKIYVDSDKHNKNGEIMLQRYYNADGMSATYDAEPLMSTSATTGELYVTYERVDYNEGIVTFTGLKVNRASTDESFTSRNFLSIRIISCQGE